jgi:peptide/nickel transport system substrate-binding protein
VGLALGGSGTALLAACGTQPPTAQVPTNQPTLPPIPTISAAEGPTSAPAATAPALGGNAAGSPTKENTLGWVGHQEVAGLSPDDEGPTVQYVMVATIHNALLELDENYVLQPTLAETFTPAPDGSSYTIKLRPDVKFHDGTTLTSEDVKYTYDFYRDPANKTSIANRFLGVKSIETPDPLTVQITMEKPNAAFMNLGATTSIVPAKYHASVGQEKYRTAPIGTGAYRLREWKAAEFTLLEAFPDHFRGAPKIPFIRQDVVPEAAQRAIALQTGEADSATWQLLAEDNLRLSSDTAAYTTFRTSSTACTHFPLNNGLPQFSDKRVRQAMMYAIDREAMINDVYKGTARLAVNNISPALAFWHLPDVTLYPFDVAKSAALLDEAGWTLGSDGVREKDGQKLTFTCTVVSGDTARRPQAEMAQQMFKAVGIDMQLAEAPVAAITQGLREGKLESSLFNWTYGGGNGEPDGSSTLRSNGGNNFNSYKNPKMDELLDQGIAEVDPAKRQAIYHEIQKLVADEVPMLYTMYWDWFSIHTKRVQGLPEKVLNGTQLYFKAYTWSLG